MASIIDNMSSAGLPPPNSQQPEACLTAEETVEARLVHPDARLLFHKLPCLRYIPIFCDAIEAFGPKCVTAITLAEFICVGIANTLIKFSLFPMFTLRYGVDVISYQRLSNTATIGTSLKPLIAMLSDHFSLFGYTKRWYLAGSCVIGAAFAVGYGLLPATLSSAQVAAAFIFITGFTKANVDILTEGHYSRLMRRIPAAAPALVSWLWFWVLLGGLIGSVIQGPLSDASLEHVGVFISAGFELLTTVLFVFNWYEEQKNRVDRAEDAKILKQKLLEEKKKKEEEIEEEEEEEEVTGVITEEKQGNELLAYTCNEPIATVTVYSNNGEYDDNDMGNDAFTPLIHECCCGAIEVNKDIWTRNWKVGVYCILMTIGAVAMALVNLFGDRWQLLYACIVMSVILCGYGFYALPLVIAKASLYTYIRLVSYIQLPGALNSFYTAGPDCLPDGPNFSFFFYNTVGHVVSSIGGIIGVILFKYIFSKRSYRLSFMLTAIIQIAANIFDLIIVQRWNRPYVSDKVIYVLGSSFFYEACNVLSYIPNIILLSQLCPRGSESMIYALLSGFSSFGGSVATSIGSLLMEFHWPVQANVELGCDFSNVKWLVLVGHFLTRSICIPLAYVLIPNTRVCDEIDVDGNVVKPKKKNNKNKNKKNNNNNKEGNDNEGSHELTSHKGVQETTTSGVEEEEEEEVRRG